MKARLALAASMAIALVAPAAMAPAQTRAVPSLRDWTRVVATTPDGGFRMGNPDAPVKLVEYLSLTCPHCAAFAREGTPPLIRNYVRRGRVSLEIRNLPLNALYVTATILARCGGPERFFPIAERLLATQQVWTGRFGAISQAQRDELGALAAGERLLRLADIGGLPALVAPHGVTAEQGRRCLADPASLARLGEMHQAAQSLGIRGTPTFLINGTAVPVNEWSSLEPLIRQAGG
jgi:protein-disulfide isomerase